MGKTLEVLHKSLLALSNGPMNIPDAAAQLSATRFAILKMELAELETEIEGKKSLLKEFMEYQKEQDELKERGI